MFSWWDRRYSFIELHTAGLDLHLSGTGGALFLLGFAIVMLALIWSD